MLKINLIKCFLQTSQVHVILLLVDLSFLTCMICMSCSFGFVCSFAVKNVINFNMESYECNSFMSCTFNFFFSNIFSRQFLSIYSIHFFFQISEISIILFKKKKILKFLFFFDLTLS